MTDFVDVFIKCWQCRGTGLRPPDGEGSTTCIYCQGEGKLQYGALDVTDILDRCNDVLAKCDDILEKLNE